MKKTKIIGALLVISLLTGCYVDISRLEAEHEIINNNTKTVIGNQGIENSFMKEIVDNQVKANDNLIVEGNRIMLNCNSSVRVYTVPDTECEKRFLRFSDNIASMITQYQVNNSDYIDLSDRYDNLTIQYSDCQENLSQLQENYSHLEDNASNCMDDLNDYVAMNCT